MSPREIKEVVTHIMDNGFSVENCAFGMGGGPRRRRRAFQSRRGLGLAFLDCQHCDFS